MAGIVGQISPGLVGAMVTPNQSSDVRSHAFLAFALSLNYVSVRAHGTYGNFRIQGSNRWAIPAQKAVSFFDDFYNRIHITPTVLDIGNSFGNQQREFYVWNSYLTAINLTSVSEEATIGLSISGQPSPPVAFTGNQERTYTLNASLNGPSIVNASYSFNFIDGPHRLKITGRRILMFPFKPNWRDSVVETYSWKTEVIEAFDGSEQRREIWREPRMTYSYKLLLSGQSTQHFDNIMWGWQNRIFAIPMWSDQTELTANVAIGDSLIHVDTANLSFTHNLVAIYEDFENFEIVEVLSVTGDTINLKYQTTKSWVKGVRVYPCLMGHLPVDVKVARYTDSTLVAAVDFDCEPASTTPYLPVAVAPTTYQGHEVITRQPNWQSQIENSLSFKFDTYDNGQGNIRWFERSKSPRVARSYKWLVKNKADMRAMREMLARRRGRLKTVLVPSWHSDFTLLSPILLNDVSLVVADNGFISMVDRTYGKKYLVIRTRDGQVFYRTITGVSQGIDGIVIGIDSQLGVDIPVNKVIAVHSLMLCRLQSDTVAIEWRTDSVAVVDTPFISVKE